MQLMHLKEQDALRLLSIMQREEDYFKNAKRKNVLKCARFQLLSFQKKIETFLKKRSVNLSWSQNTQHIHVGIMIHT